ncbi:aldose 1-epimerase [Vibrio variabilis]|uniref:Putative glucose-6-phosphate 1-epimerase n=1 Tax=Vibrio variabilis TaxID=990271 RepID=A0ABQ0JIF9_9VIBR|nr:aldose 1-epimerase [Vibrio variabilis]
MNETECVASLVPPVSSLPLDDWRFGRCQINYRDSVEVLEIEHPQARCEIALMGAQLLSYQPSGRADYFWLSEQAKFDGVTAIRGGVPICWPWFGKANKVGSQAPSHGFARLMKWDVARLISDENSAVIELTLDDSSATWEWFPYRFQLQLKVTIGASLKMELVIHNRDAHVFEFTGALHSYFRVSDIADSRVHGLSNQCLNSVSEGVPIRVDRPFRVEKALDHVFENPRQFSLECDDGLTIHSHNADSIVVWNPWLEGAQSMNDMGDSEFRTMICLEPAIFKNAVTLAPNQSFSLDMTVSHPSGETHI